MAYEILIRPALKDNFAVLIHCPRSGLTAAIDAPEAAPYREMLGSRGWTLDAILIPHHHADHTQAIGELKTLGTPTVYGPRGEADKIPQIDERVRGGDEIAFGHGRLQVIDVTDLEKPKSVAFYEPEFGGVHNVWVAGDTLYMGAYNGGFRAFDVSGELHGDLRAQQREMVHVNTADLNGFVPNTAMTWGVVVRDGLAYVNDMYNGLWIIRMEPRKAVILP